MSDRPLAPGEYPWPPQRPWPKAEGPYVRAVTLCEALIEERSGAVSLVRLLNTMYVRGQLPMGWVSFPVTLFVSLERVPGTEPTVPIRIMLATPLGTTAVDEETTIEPTGRYRAAQTRFQMRFPIVMEGTYVIGVVYNDRLLTAVTVEVVLTDDDSLKAGDTPIHSRWEVRQVWSRRGEAGPAPDPAEESTEDTSE